MYFTIPYLAQKMSFVVLNTLLRRLFKSRFHCTCELVLFENTLYRVN